VLATLGIHKALFGITDQVNRSVAEEATRQLWVFTLKPKSIRIQEKINQTLFRHYFPGYEAYFDFSGITELQENFESILTQAKALRELGYTLNEVNEYFDLGMDEVTDTIGNTRFVPSSLIPFDAYEETPEPPAKNSPADEDSTKAYKALDELLEPNRISKASKNYLNKFLLLQRKEETAFYKKIRKHFSEELGKVMSVVLRQKSIKTTVDINTILAEIQTLLSNNKVNIADTLDPLYTWGSELADRLAVDTVGASAIPAASPLVVEQLVNRIQDISKHTYRLIRTQVKTGVDAGETMDEIADRIRAVYKFNASRARTIARTETQSVINRTTDERYKKEGVQKKQWLSAGDSSVRPTHVDNNNTGVVAYNYKYSNGQQFPGDGRGGASENCNCRCCIAPIIE